MGEEESGVSAMLYIPIVDPHHSCIAKQYFISSSLQEFGLGLSNIMNQMANLALEGGDPRDPTHPVATVIHGNVSVEKQQAHAVHDSSITFEEYMYWASITRAEEKEANARFVEATGPKVSCYISLTQYKSDMSRHSRA